MNQNINNSANEMDNAEIMIGLVFPNEEAAVEAIDAWSVKAMCPLSKIRYQKVPVSPWCYPEVKSHGSKAIPEA